MSKFDSLLIQLCELKFNNIKELKRILFFKLACCGSVFVNLKTKLSFSAQISLEKKVLLLIVLIKTKRKKKLH